MPDYPQIGRAKTTYIVKQICASNDIALPLRHDKPHHLTALDTVLVGVTALTLSGQWVQAILNGYATLNSPTCLKLLTNSLGIHKFQRPQKTAL